MRVFFALQNGTADAIYWPREMPLPREGDTLSILRESFVPDMFYGGHKLTSRCDTMKVGQIHFEPLDNVVTIHEKEV